MRRLAVAFALVAVSASAQTALPDLSVVAGGLAGPPPAAASPYRSGLAVPSVQPGAAASGVAWSLRDAVSEVDDDVADQLEALMPALLSGVEGALEQNGLARRDFGVAAGVSFVGLWEAARGQSLADASSTAAARGVAAAVAERWGPAYRALAPEDQEAAYETLLARAAVLAGLAEQLGPGSDVGAPLRRASAETFEAVFGADPSAVSIDGAGRISGLAAVASPSPPAARPALGGPDSRTASAAAGDVAGSPPAASSAGVEVFLKYTTWYDYTSGFDRSAQTPLLLFPDGTAVEDYPSDPVASFTPSAVRAALEPDDRAQYVGTWRRAGDEIALTFDGETRRLRRTPRGWYDGDETPVPDDSYDVYFPAVPLTREQLLGPWETQSLYVSGTAGGAAPMVALGSSGARVFYADGTFSEDRESFASVTDANVGDGFRAGAGTVGVYDTNRGRAAGRWRLDGLVLTLEWDGATSAVPAFVMPEWSVTDTDIWVGDRYWERPE